MAEILMVGNQAIGALSDTSEITTYDVDSEDWVANQDSTTSSDYPYIAVIECTDFDNNDKPVWQLRGAGDIPTSEERDNINLVLAAWFSNTGITLYATDAPACDLVLDVLKIGSNTAMVGATGGGGGGHTIENSAGTAMTARGNLQFAGYLKTTDDGSNNRTVVTDSATEITWEAYQALTDEQRAGNKYLITNYGGNVGEGTGINDLADVNISSPSNGQILTYNATSQKWINGSTRRLIATSTGNTTWGAQLAELKVAYNNLSNDEKRNAILTRNTGGHIYQLASIQGAFSRTWVSTNAIDMAIVDLNDSVIRQFHSESAASFTINDLTSTTLADTISLSA